MKNKKVLFIILIIIIGCLFDKVYAAEDAFVNDSANFGGCGTYEWCYSSMGIRISLYEYDTSLIYHGSVDYSAYDVRPLAGDAYYSSARAGVVAYKSGKKTLKNLSSWVKGSIPDILKSTKNFPSYNNNEGNATSNALKNELSKYFAFNTNDAAQIKTRLLTEFGIADIDLSKAYVTVEPTALFYKNSDKNNKRYYGTIYEFAQVHSQMGVTEFKFLVSQYHALKAANPTGDYENNGFLSDDASDNSYILIIAENAELSGSSNKNKFDNQKNSNKGFGIGVFWMGQYAPATCLSTCGSYSGENRMKCASDYCDADSDKEGCMNACGVNNPGFNGCGPDVEDSADPTVCSQTADAELKHCTPYINSYYTETCEEGTTVTYSNDLPTTLIRGTGGFNYSVQTNGVRKCTLKFDYNYYLYQYYIEKNSLRDSTVEPKLTSFKNKGDSTYYNYSFDDSDDGVTFKVNGTNYKLSKVSDKEVSHDFNESADKLTKTYISSNESLFALPQMCYSLKNNKPTLPVAGCGTDNIKEYIDYYGYYSTSTADVVPTETVTKKDKSALESINTCQYYNIDPNDDDVNCYTELVTISGDIAIAKYYITNRGGATVTNCKVNGANVNCNMVTSPGSTDVGKPMTFDEEIIEASVTYKYGGNTITKQCPLKVNKNPQPALRCTVEFKPVEYDAIRNYCNTNWKTDLNGYTSSTDCYNRCSSDGRRNTCKTLKKCNDPVGIKDYCKLFYGDDGYKSEEACINDCSCNNNESLDYIYRPIATGTNASLYKYNAFPNRDAGSNWIGYENLTEETEEEIFEKDPIYVIELDGEKIQEIRTNPNNNTNDYIDYDGESDSKGYFKSDFIRDNPEIFKKTCNTAGGCVN